MDPNKIKKALEMVGSIAAVAASIITVIVSMKEGK